MANKCSFANRDWRPAGEESIPEMIRSQNKYKPVDSFNIRYTYLNYCVPPGKKIRPQC